MGVSALRELSVIEQRELASYTGEVVAIDAHHWLFRYMTVQVRYRDESYYTTSDGDEVPNLLGMLRGLPTLINAGVKPVFVFDGVPEELKAAEIESRRESRTEAKEKMEAAREAGDVTAARKFKSQSQRLTPVIHETSRELLRLLGIPFVEANGAGEGYAAQLAVDDTTPVSAVFSGDYDALLFGSPETIRPISGGDGVERIVLDETLESIGVSYDEFIDAAILIGTDYNPGVSGIGPKRAVKFVQGDRDVTEIAADWGSDTLTTDRVQAIRDIYQSPPTGERVTQYGDGEMCSPSQLANTRTFLTDQWEIPNGVVEDDFDRFTIDP